MAVFMLLAVEVGADHQPKLQQHLVCDACGSEFS